MRSVIRWWLLAPMSAGVVAACGDPVDVNQLTGGPGPGSEGPATSGGPTGSDGVVPGVTTAGAATDAGSVAPTSGGNAPPPTPAGAGLPCNVSALLAAKCTGCHSKPPVNGSLVALVTTADLLATAKEDPSKNEAQLSLVRMQSATSPMPPASFGKPATAADIAALEAWITGNYQGSCDAGAPPPGAVDPFAGAGAFVAQTGSSTHNPGKNCMGGCHDHGFTFAGTVTNGAGQGVAGAEVRLVDADGKAILVHTGSNGNFRSSTAWRAPAHVGARTTTNKLVMVTALGAANGGCNGCHANGATTAPIHVP